MLQRTVESLTNDVLNKVNVRQDINELINEGKTKLGSSESLPKEVTTAFSNITDMMSGTVVMSSLQGIMQTSSRTNNGSSSVTVRNKS